MRFIEYIKDTKNEMNFVKWPTRKQAMLYTVLVIIISVAVALLLGVFDFGFARITNSLINK
ncbi:MAG: preprotein translocase subunit SecE [bacterium]|nr:preprotein translocase subunit SecE [bacterium]